MNKVIVWSAALALIGAVAGCGSGVERNGPASMQVSVGLQGNVFVPASISINAGDTITWVWDAGPHTVTSGQPGAPDGKFCSLPAGTTPSAQSCAGTGYAQGVGATYSHKFDQAGSYPYYCTVHGAMMTGVVTVGMSPTTGY